MAVVAQSRRCEKRSRSRSSSSDVPKGSRDAKAHPKRKLPTKQYTSAEWRRMEEIIKQLYCEERVPVAELIRRLHGMGFEVNERMLHTRIRKWKIGRNHKFSEMRMAAHLLADYLDRQRQQSNLSASGQRSTADKRAGMPSFDIRGERVDYKEVMRYFRRKKIPDPVSWVKQQEDRFDLSEDVVIVENTDPVSVSAARSSEDDEDASDQEHEEFQRLSAQGEHAALEHVSDNSNNTRQISNVPYLDDGYFTLMGGLPHTDVDSSFFSVPTVFRPQPYYAIEHLNQSMMIYISSYLSSPASKGDLEPTVHANTVHAIFASKIQDGISLLASVSPRAAKTKLRKPEVNATKAFASFENGFGLVHRILKNNNPMSLALMLSIVCELANRATTAGTINSTVGVLLVKLLTFIHEMALAVCGLGHPLTVFFGILAREYMSPTILFSSGSLPVMELILTSLNLALAQFDLQSTYGPPGSAAQDWKQLYVRERLCDALYYCGSPYLVTRSSMRRRLLYDQEARYGPTARNVLWTLTNVADDCLTDGDIDRAIGHFQDALDRAETLVDGYGRAKTSFAAREGLGRCWLRKAEEAEAEALWQEEQSRGRVRAGNVFDPLRAPQESNPHRSSDSACCLCHCHQSTRSNPSSSQSSTDNTGPSTPVWSGSSGSSPQSRHPTSTKPHGPHLSHSHRHDASPPAAHKRRQCLTRAYGYFVAAEDEARTYFEASNRRITRVSLRRQEVAELLGIVATPESGSGSASEDEAREMSADGGADNSTRLHSSRAATNISLVLGCSSDLGFDV